jgi:hypothetical protein
MTLPSIPIVYTTPEDIVQKRWEESVEADRVMLVDSTLAAADSTGGAAGTASFDYGYSSTGKLTSIVKHIGGRNFSRTLTWSGNNLTNVSVWTEI